MLNVTIDILRRGYSRGRMSFPEEYRSLREYQSQGSESATALRYNASLYDCTYVMMWYGATEAYIEPAIVALPVLAVNDYGSEQTSSSLFSLDGN